MGFKRGTFWLTPYRSSLPTAFLRLKGQALGIDRCKRECNRRERDLERVLDSRAREMSRVRSTVVGFPSGPAVGERVIRQHSISSLVISKQFNGMPASKEASLISSRPPNGASAFFFSRASTRRHTASRTSKRTAGHRSRTAESATAISGQQALVGVLQTLPRRLIALQRCGASLSSSRPSRPRN